MRAKHYTKETILTIGVKDRGFPKFAIGDTIAVVQRIKEGDKERLQTFEGDVIAMNNNGIATTVTVRKIGANGVAVEKIYPLFSPRIDSIKFIRKGKVRRAKLYFLRGRVGRAARVERKVMTAAEKELEGKKVNE